MRAVAEKAGVTAGAIYRHFAAKEALVACVVDSALERFEIHLLESIVSLPVGSAARISALGRAYLEFAYQHEQEFRVLFMPGSGTRRRLSEIFGKAGYPVLRRCVVEAMAVGELRRADPDLVALHLWSRVHGIVTLLLACDLSAEIDLGDPPHTLTLLDRTRDFVLDGLRPPAKPAPKAEGPTRSIREDPV